MASSSETRSVAVYQPQRAFELYGTDKYVSQYSDLYFLRLALLRTFVEITAHEDWDDVEIAGERAHKVERVLDVRQGELVWVTGTVYADLPLKPNILEELGQTHWNEGAPTRRKYKAGRSESLVILEDESGRLRLTGSAFSGLGLVTGCVIAVLGTENSEGEFETIDVKLPDFAPQLNRWPYGGRPDQPESVASRKRINPSAQSKGPLVAIVTGLGVKGHLERSINRDILASFLLGELPHLRTTANRITRLLVVGNSIVTSKMDQEMADQMGTDADAAARKTTGMGEKRKNGYDSSTYNPLPTSDLDDFLEAILPSLPVTLMPGPDDPSNHALPQQPLHPALLSRARQWMSVERPNGKVNEESSADIKNGLYSTTNPSSFILNGFHFLAMASQTVDDVLKYVDLPSYVASNTLHSDTDGDVDQDPTANTPDRATAQDRLAVMDRMLRWRCIAPTAPDTLPCFPYQDTDPFIVANTPHVLISGGGSEYGSRRLRGQLRPEWSRAKKQNGMHSNQIDHSEVEVQLITVPDFGTTGVVVLCDLETLDCSAISL